MTYYVLLLVYRGSLRISRLHLQQDCQYLRRDGRIANVRQIVEVQESDLNHKLLQELPYCLRCCGRERAEELLRLAKGRRKKETGDE